MKAVSCSLTDTQVMILPLISGTDFLRLRKEKVKPIFDKFHSWLLEKQQTVAILNSSKTAEDWNKLLPWNIEITPFKMRGEWVE